MRMMSIMSPLARQSLKANQKSGLVGFCPQVVMRSAKRVQLPDVVAGTIPWPSTIVDSSGGDYVPTIISALRALESRYSDFFLVVV